MTMMVLKAAFVSLNGVDRSDHCNKIELSVEVEEKDVTTFGSDGWKALLGGLASGGLALSFKTDYAAAELDDALWPLFGTVVPFEVRASNAAVGASNPKYSGNVLVKELKPLGGAPGDVAEFDVSWPTSGQVSRATA